MHQKLMPKNIIIVQQWHSGIGEQILALHFFLNLILYIRRIEPTCCITYVIDTNYSGCGTDAIKFGINFNTIKTYVNKIEFDNRVLASNELKNEYQQLFLEDNKSCTGMFGQSLYFDKLIFIKKECVDENFAKLIHAEVNKLKTLPQFNITAAPTKRSLTTKIVMFDILSDNVKRIAMKYIRKHSLKRFTSLYLREDTFNADRIGIYSSGDYYSFIKSTKDKFDFYINTNKHYFLSSNNIDIKKEYCLNKNVHFINRTERARKTLGMQHCSNTKEMSDMFAFVELAVLIKSKHIVHTMDCKRELVSLFLWYPAFYNKIPITGLSCFGQTSVLVFDEYGYCATK